MATDLPNIARVAVEGTFNAERFVNVFHFANRDGTPWTVTDLTILIGNLAAAASFDYSLLNIYQFMDAGVLIDTITATTLDTTTPIQVSTTVALAGTSVGTDLPPLLAVVVKWGTSVATRRRRGRTFLCGVNSNFPAAANSDRIDSTVLGTISTAAGDFMTAWAADPNFAFVILSPTDRAADVAVPWEEVASASANPLLCVQRRRRERP